MTSPKDTSPEEEGVDADEAEREEDAVKSDCHDRNWALLRLMVV